MFEFVMHHSLLSFELLYILISFPIAVFLWHILPPIYQQPKRLIILSFFGFSVFIPVLGILLLIVGLILLYWMEKQKKQVAIKTTQQPIYDREKITPPIRFGEGGALIRAQSDDVPIFDRLRSLTAINVTASPCVNIINRNMLQSGADELRLYAFSLLEKQETSINNQINEALQELKKAKSKTEKASAEKRLALLYWELVYLDLVQNDLLEATLEKAIHYANLAVEQLPNDADLWVLLGKIYLYKKDNEKAKEALNRARELNAPYSKTLPYLAELSFNECNFEELRNYFNMSETLKDIPKLAPIVDFWI